MEILKNSPEGNAFAIMGVVRRLLKEVGRTDEIADAMERMQSGDYDNLCKVAEEVTNGSIRVVDTDDEGDLWDD